MNFNTVNRAYRQLQRDGLIRSTPGKGAVVIRPGRSGEGERGPLGVASYRASDEEIDSCKTSYASPASRRTYPPVGRRMMFA